MYGTCLHWLLLVIGSYYKCIRQYGSLCGVANLRRLQGMVKENADRRKHRATRQRASNRSAASMWRFSKENSVAKESRRGWRVRPRVGGKIYATARWHLRVLPTGGTCHCPTCLYPHKNKRVTKNRLDIAAAAYCERKDSLSRSIFIEIIALRKCQHADSCVLEQKYSTQSHSVQNWNLSF